MIDQSTLLILSSAAMALVTLGILLYLGFNRFKAIRGREMSIKFFRTYDEGSQPERLHLLMRHVQNHFEVPPLFHMVVLATFMTNNVTLFAVIFAWLYVGLRCLHTYIHLGSNNVSRRFLVFGSSLLVLIGLWLGLLVQLVFSQLILAT